MKSAQTHSYAELNQDKREVDKCIFAAKQDIKAIKIEGALHGRYIPAAQLRKLETILHEMGVESQRLQQEMHLSKKTEAKMFGRAFIDVCKEILPDSQFAQILKEARSRIKGALHDEILSSVN